MSRCGFFLSFCHDFLILSPPVFEVHHLHGPVLREHCEKPQTRRNVQKERELQLHWKSQVGNRLRRNKCGCSRDERRRPSERLKESVPRREAHRATTARGEETSDNIGEKVVTAHQSGEIHKTISRRFQLHPCAARLIISREASVTAALPRRGRPSEPSPRGTRDMINQVKANLHVTSRELQTFWQQPGGMFTRLERGGK